MPPSVVVPISLIVVGIVGIGLSIPMLLNRIPRNQVYGLRTKLSLSSDEIWYPANRFAAKLLAHPLDGVGGRLGHQICANVSTSLTNGSAQPAKGSWDVVELTVECDGKCGVGKN